MYMQTVAQYKKPRPLAIWVMKTLLILPYVIYVPISVFRTDVFLFILDILLFLGMLVTIMDTERAKWIFGGKKTVLVFVSIYVLAIILRAVVDLTSVSIQMITALRNLFFGMQILIVSSAWINTQKRVDMVMKILVLGAFFTAIWGIRQLVFGFMGYELERLGKMGSSLREMEFMGRKRISSGFGDPLTFSFFLMMGLFAYSHVRKRKQLLWFTKTLHPWSVMVIFIALVLTLTRAPLLGLMVGAIVYMAFSLRITKKLITNVALVALGLVLLVLGLNWLVESRVLADSESDGLRAIHGGLESFWTLFQLMNSEEMTPEMYFLVNQSKDARSNAWAEGVSYLLSHPWGVGFTGNTSFTFSIGDVGILRQGLEIGIIGITSIVFLFITIALNGFADTKCIPNFEKRKQGYFFIAIWVSIFVVCGISAIIETSVIAIVIWTIGGILLNQKKIYNSEIKEKIFRVNND